MQVTPKRSTAQYVAPGRKSQRPECPAAVHLAQAALQLQRLGADTNLICSLKRLIPEVASAEVGCA